MAEADSADWRSALDIVKPVTVIAWHRHGFRLLRTWKIRHGRVGRPGVSREVRNLIRRMRRENPLWGAPKYLVRNRKPLYRADDPLPSAVLVSNVGA